jgi:membrane fusion protein (multidrug efflux system)
VSFLEDRKDAAAAAVSRPAVRVPSAAVFKEGDTSYVWRVQNEQLERVAVRTGGERDGQIEVVSGINSGDAVVTSPLDGMKDGDRVKIKGV